MGCACCGAAFVGVDWVYLFGLSFRSRCQLWRVHGCQGLSAERGVHGLFSKRTARCIGRILAGRMVRGHLGVRRRTGFRPELAFPGTVRTPGFRQLQRGGFDELVLRDNGMVAPVVADGKAITQGTLRLAIWECLCAVSVKAYLLHSVFVFLMSRSDRLSFLILAAFRLRCHPLRMGL